MADDTSITEREVIKKLRKRREGKIQVGKFTFLFRRPTQMEVETMLEKLRFNVDFVMTFVTGWENVTWNDIVGGGETDEPAPFSQAVLREWVQDRGEFWDPIFKAILDSYNEWLTNKGDLAKN